MTDYPSDSQPGCRQEFQGCRQIWISLQFARIPCQIIYNLLVWGALNYFLKYVRVPQYFFKQKRVPQAKMAEKHWTRQYNGLAHWYKFN